jgi:predicted aspartyl protease
MTHVGLAVANVSDPEKSESLDFLVDSGPTYSVVPQAVLDRLGIRPISEQTFRLANGEHVSRKKGVALFRYGERVGGSDVIFGEEDDARLLGAFTLESLGLGLDPLKRELFELPMLLTQSAMGSGN